MLIVATVAACRSTPSGPTTPTGPSLAGRWDGMMTGRLPCAGAWDRVVLTLDSTGAGELVTADGQHFSAILVSGSGVRRIDVAVPAGTGECGTIQLFVSTLEGSGPAAFSGDVQGRCCGTVAGSFRFVRSGA